MWDLLALIIPTCVSSLQTLTKHLSSNNFFSSHINNLNNQVLEQRTHLLPNGRKKSIYFHWILSLLYFHNDITSILAIVALTHGIMSICKNESPTFMKGQFRIPVICFELNGVLWQGCILRIIPVHWHFWL